MGFDDVLVGVNRLELVSRDSVSLVMSLAFVCGHESCIWGVRAIGRCRQEKYIKIIHQRSFFLVSE